MALRTAFQSIGVFLSAWCIMAVPMSAPALSAQPGVPAFAKIRQSLAVVAAADGKEVSFGTAFCVQSDGKRSYFLTNAHVVKDNDVVYLRLASDRQVYKGFVLRTSVAPLDAAVIEIEKADVPALSLSRDRPQPGTAIAIAGYPSIQLQTDLEPSVHAGIVNDIVSDYYIEHDAVTDHGNSGGPLFDPQTGLVYGIVTSFVPSQTARAVQNNLAIVAEQAAAFLRNAGIDQAFSPQSRAVLQLSAAGTLAPSPLATASVNAPPSVPIPPQASPGASASPTPTMQSQTLQPRQSASPRAAAHAPPRDELKGSCAKTFAGKAYREAVDACAALVLDLAPDLERIKNDTPAEAILPMTDAFWGTAALALSYNHLGNRSLAREQAMHAIGWGYFIFKAIEAADPHFYNASDKSLANDLVPAIKTLEDTFPGATAAEMKTIEAAKL